MDSIALRIQRLDQRDQVLVLAYVMQLRLETGRFAPSDITDLFFELAITPPQRVSNVLLSLEKGGLASRTRGRGAVWSLTPEGRQRLLEIGLEIDTSVLLAEAKLAGSSLLGGTVHPTLPPSLAPPEIERALGRFLEEFPFESNVFGMTRFPEERSEQADPVAPALDLARAACRDHGLSFHLASDRALTDNLWANVNAHMWASKYGIAFFEDRRGRGINYNMTIEVGSMLMAGRRCAILRDRSIAAMPTDLVGQIYKSIDLDDSPTIRGAIHSWLRDDLAIGACPQCDTKR